MLTNWKTISNSIKRYKKLSADLKKENTGFTKKENLKMGIQRDKLERSLGGIAEMKKVPEMIFIIDVNLESIAVQEAIKLNIPIVAIVDTNSDPTGVKFPIPGNDDARRAINLYSDLVRETIIDAQKNIIIKKQNEEPENRIKVEKTQTVDNTKTIETKAKSKKQVEKVEKKPKSIFSKIKSIAQKKLK